MIIISRIEDVDVDAKVDRSQGGAAGNQVMQIGCVPTIFAISIRHISVSNPAPGISEMEKRTRRIRTRKTRLGADDGGQLHQAYSESPPLCNGQQIRSQIFG